MHFKQNVNACKLIDLSFKGNPFAYAYRTHGVISTSIRLDRVLYNLNWHLLLLKASAHHLPRLYFNHNPLLLYLIGYMPSFDDKPFYFKAVWFIHKGFEEVMQRSKALEQLNIVKNIKALTNTVRDFNVNVFGKRRFLARLDGI